MPGWKHPPPTAPPSAFVGLALQVRALQPGQKKSPASGLSRLTGCWTGASCVLAYNQRTRRYESVGQTNSFGPMGNVAALV